MPPAVSPPSLWPFGTAAPGAEHTSSGHVPRVECPSATEVWAVLREGAGSGACPAPSTPPHPGAGRGSHRVEGPRADDRVAGREGPSRVGQHRAPAPGVVLWGGQARGPSRAQLSGHWRSSHTSSPAPAHPPSRRSAYAGPVGAAPLGEPNRSWGLASRAAWAQLTGQRAPPRGWACSLSVTPHPAPLTPQPRPPWSPGETDGRLPGPAAG